mmetsp:Transcript_46061/g.84441  ORF Transcript_46061/g.84441 Transcript_46061/m.84441 type:complete len:191 (+) Transcript_46061:81-653(+)
MVGGLRGTTKQGWSMGFAVWRQRKDDRGQRDEDEAQKEDVVETDSAKILKKKPHSRLKWLQKAIVQVAHKKIKVQMLYDIMVDRQFSSAVSEDVGKQMRTCVLANLHLFSSKQQSFLKSAECKLGQASESLVESSEERDSPRGGGRHGSTRERPRSRSRDRARRRSDSKSPGRSRSLHSLRRHRSHKGRS